MRIHGSASLFLWNLREAEVRADTDNEKTYAFIIMNHPDGKVPNLLDSLKAILNNKFAAGAAVDGVCPDGSEGAFNFATAFSVVLQTGIKFVAEETKGVLGIMMGGAECGDTRREAKCGKGESCQHEEET